MTAAPVFETLGCRLNAYETEAMRDLAASAGVEDACVVNTCAVTAEAVRKSRQAVRKLRRANPGAKLVVTGCAAQVDPDGFSGMREVDVLVGNSRKLRRDTWAGISKGLGAPQPSGRPYFDDIMSAKASEPHPPAAGSRSRAYVQVQNGCDHRCTFCIIPYGRGNSRSVPTEGVVEQVGALVERGYCEVVLTGVDLTSWGADVPGAPRLGNLAARILKSVPDLKRLRVSSVDPVEIDPEFLDLFGSEPRLMPHLHLSLQAGDNMILKRMKRRHSREDAIRFCEQARSLRPDALFGADLIAGFPTETDAMFDNSARLVEECGLAFLHVFPFSPREGTPAARMPQVPRDAVRERAARLREVGASERRKRLDEFVGKRAAVLMESPRTGRTEQFAEAAFDSDHPVGSIVECLVAGRKGSGLAVAELPVAVGTTGRAASAAH